MLLASNGCNAPLTSYPIVKQDLHAFVLSAAWLSAFPTALGIPLLNCTRPHALPPSRAVRVVAADGCLPAVLPLVPQLHPMTQHQGVPPPPACALAAFGLTEPPRQEAQHPTGSGLQAVRCMDGGGGVLARPPCSSGCIQTLLHCFYECSLDHRRLALVLSQPVPLPLRCEVC